MVGQHQDTVIRLSRDNTSTPWGFRLQGGLESDTPLTVQRVSVYFSKIIRNFVPDLRENKNSAKQSCDYCHVPGSLLIMRKVWQ